MLSRSTAKSVQDRCKKAREEKAPDKVRTRQRTSQRRRRRRRPPRVQGAHPGEPELVRDKKAYRH